MRPRFLAFWLFGLTMHVSGCSNEPAPAQADVVAPASSDDLSRRPVLVEAGLDVVPEIAKSGSPWNGPVISDTTHFSGPPINLGLRTVVFPGGLIKIDRTDDGGIHRILVQSGVADRCGSPAVVAAAFVELTKAIPLPVADAEQVRKLQAIWSSKTTGFDEMNLRNVRVAAGGGCLPWVSVKPAS